LGICAPFVGRNLLPRPDAEPENNVFNDFHVYDGDTTDPEALNFYASSGHDQYGPANNGTHLYTEIFFGPDLNGGNFESNAAVPKRSFPVVTPTFGAGRGDRVDGNVDDLCCVPSVSAEILLAEIRGAARTQSAPREEENRRSLKTASWANCYFLDHRRQGSILPPCRA